MKLAVFFGAEHLKRQTDSMNALLTPSKLAQAIAWTPDRNA